MEFTQEQKDLLFHTFHLDQRYQSPLQMEDIQIKAQEDTLSLTITDAGQKEILFHPNGKDLQITIRPA